KLDCRQEPERPGAEVREIRKYSREIGTGDAEPLRERGEVLIERRGWNPAAARAGVVRAAERERRKRPIKVPAQDAAAHDQAMSSPCVIRSTSRIEHQCAAELALGEGGHLSRDTERRQ